MDLAKTFATILFVQFNPFTYQSALRSLEVLAMSLSSTPHCLNCKKSGATTKLLRCQGCNVVYYCGRDCQLANREDHKKACNAIKKGKVAMDNEEQRLRTMPPDFMTPANLFEEHAGHFWGILETRTYMRLRYALVEAILKIKTYTAVQTAHGHILDMLRLCRGDNMGVRSLAPSLYLRLGQDQACYDFCLWWITISEDGHYDWGDLSNPYFDIKDADVLETGNRRIFHKWGDLNMVIAITLMKVRLLLNVRALYNASMLAQRSPQIPQEIQDEIRKQFLSGTALVDRVKVTDVDEQAKIIKKLEQQVFELYKAVDVKNEYYWRTLLEPGGHVTARPPAFSPGSMEETEIALMYSYAAWTESPGAIDVIRDLMDR
ncbi:MAG: hypothetical protein LQ350_004874 [Teloschistes chrysophthalmus]|nr:MAG: hypothetical protein LQ350_004874 [Niorma chrysophthalma]